MVALSHRNEKAPPVTIKTFQATATNIRKLTIRSARTFVSEDANATAVWVSVTSTSPRILDTLSFSEELVDGEGSLSIEASFDVDDDYGDDDDIDVDDDDGDDDDIDYDDIEFLVDVFVPTQTIRTLVYGGSDTLTVNRRVLASKTDAAVAVSTVGDGDLFLQDDDLELNSVSVVSLGSGDIQWTVSAVSVATSINVQASGDGDIKLIAANAIAANMVTLQTMSSGDISVSTTSLTVPVELTTTILGSGDVTYETNGRCGHHKLTLLGSGDAFTSAIACESTKVFAASHGDVYVTSTKDLQVSRLGSSTVFVTRPQPPIASGSFQLVERVPLHTIKTSDAPRHELTSGGLTTPHRATSHGGGVGGFIVLLLMVYGVVRLFKWCCCRRRKAKNASATIALHPSQQHAYYHGGQGSYPATAPGAPSPYQQQPPHAQYAYYPSQVSASYSGTTNYTPLTQSGGGAPYQQHQPAYSQQQPPVPASYYGGQATYGASTDHVYGATNPTYGQGPPRPQPTAPAYPSKE